MPGTKKRPETKNIKNVQRLIDFYDAWLREGSASKVAARLDVNPQLVTKWIKQDPNLKLARDLALERREAEASFQEYVYKHLSDEAREVWDQIQFWDGSYYDKKKEILSNCSKRLRQELWIHAYIRYGFDYSEACKVIGISRATLESWMSTDLPFKQLVEEMKWHKKNFFERSLVNLVELGHPQAIMFVNRTINADRGYSEKVQVEHSGSVQTDGVNIEDLDLDLETRRKVLQAIRDKQGAEQKPDNRAIDVTSTAA